jgi:hypothetical protein
MAILEGLRAFLGNWLFLLIWGLLVLASLAVVLYDLTHRNNQIMSLMKVVWTLTVLYSGPLGLLIYWYSGRKWITRDSLWRRTWRSDAHCYSGCGAGEIIGVSLAVGVLALSNWPAAILTFALAYTFGFGLTVGPLMQGGMGPWAAVKDAFWGETASITVMEIGAIGTDLWIAPKAHFGQPLFWGALIFSLSVGLLVAYPVNAALLRWGVKEGMMNPQHAGEHHHQ